MEPAKLKGKEYLNFWKARMRLGPDQVAHCAQNAEAQGDFYFEQISQFLPTEQPDQILEFGCGYGRVLKRLRGRYPTAWLFGVDLSEAAVGGAWNDEQTILCRALRVPPEIAGVDLAVTCTVLQHITDDRLLHVAANSLALCLRPGGRIVLLENISSPGAGHVRDMAPEDYMRAFPTGSFEWEDPVACEWAGERHSVMAGIRR